MSEDDDYPDYVIPLAKAVVAGKVGAGRGDLRQWRRRRGVRNKIRAIRARASIHDHFAFLVANFSQAERHLRRLDRVASLEAGKAKRSDD